MASLLRTKLTIPVHGADNHSANALDLGIFYTGPHLVLGPELGVSWTTLLFAPRTVLTSAPLTRDADLRTYQALLVVRYYW